MIRAILDQAYETVDTQSLLQLTEAIWRSDYTFTFPAFERTAKLVDEHFKKWNLDHKILRVPADGKHIPEKSAWRMPMAWECKNARLEILTPESAVGPLLERKKTNCCVVQYSGSTPKHGIDAEIVFIDMPHNGRGRGHFQFSEHQVKGKFVLINADIRGPMKKQLYEMGCLGVLLAFNGNYRCEDPEATFWTNGWSDDSGGWAFTQGDSPLPGMVLSKSKADYLIGLLAKGPVTARMDIDAEYFDGHIHLPTGFLPGETREEILLTGHAAEQGADDNASGCAVVVETMRIVKKMANQNANGKLKRGIRAFLTNECYGTAGYVSKSMASLKRTVGALDWDSVGVDPRSQMMRLPVHRNPWMSAGYTDTLAQRLFESSVRHHPAYAWYMSNYSMGDTFFMDPELNAPTIYGGGMSRCWHTTTDTMDVIDPDAMHLIAAISAAYAYFLATAGKAEAIWLAEETAAIQHSTIAEYTASMVKTMRLTDAEYADHPLHGGVKRDVALGRMIDTLTILGETAVNAVKSVLRLVDGDDKADVRTAIKPLTASLARFAKEGVARLRDVAGIEPKELDYRSRQFAERHIPVKKFIGPPAFDAVESRRRRNELIAEHGAGRWDTTLQTALFWTDGKRTMHDIIVRTRAERYAALDPDGLIEQYRGLSEAGLLDFKRLEDGK
ncbi:MAG: M28 family peptidase [Planctomycetota bacterium]